MTKIAKVTKQTNKPGDKKKWIKYIIHSVGETKYTTFDKKLAETASDAAKTDQECLILFEYNEQYKTNEIQAIDLMPDEGQDDNINPSEQDHDQTNCQ